MIKAVIFDLDGTLANTLLDLSESANRALVKYGFKPHPADAYKLFVGNGIKKMLERASGCKADEETFSAVEKTFFEHYNVHYCDKTAVYDGVPELIAEIKKMGLKMAVVTNKEDSVAKEVVLKLYGDIFDVVCGNREGLPAKPDPTATLLVMKQLGVSPEECIFLGDSGVDVQTGVRSGAVAVGETWGFRDEKELRENGARYIINKPSELVDIVGDFQK